MYLLLLIGWWFFGRFSVGVMFIFGGWWFEMVDIFYGCDYFDLIWCDEDG